MRDGPSLTRRDLLKGLATVPALAALGVAAQRHRAFRQESTLSALGIDLDQLAPGAEASDVPPPGTDGRVLNVGIIGVGLRGKQLLVAAGFARPDQLQPGEHLGTDGERPLGIRIAGVCDLYRPNREWGMAAAGGSAVSYRRAQDLIDAPGIDAVIVATPDHWHVPLVVAAARAGKHVYVEKCFSLDVEGALRAVRAVREAGIVLQLGHQGRHDTTFATAREVVRAGLLGDLHGVEASTNRNGPVGAWVLPIPADVGPADLDWETFLGEAPSRAFDPDRFFRWRKYWDYGTGLAGDMFTHEWDGIDHVLGGLSIPATAAASGGIYRWRDGRDVPDSYHVVYEYPDRGMTLTYEGTQSNGWRRDKLFLGSDATMTLVDGLRVYADPDSTRYADAIRGGQIEPGRPIASYLPGRGRRIDAEASATRQWAASRGLLYSVGPTGRYVSTAYLHLRDWVDAIRTRRKARCHEDVALVEAVTAHMGTLSLRWGCRVRWDAAGQTVVPDLREVGAWQHRQGA